MHCLPSQSFSDDASAFDALQTLADLSLMMPTEDEDGKLSKSTFSFFE